MTPMIVRKYVTVKIGICLKNFAVRFLKFPNDGISNTYQWPIKRGFIIFPD